MIVFQRLFWAAIMIVVAVSHTRADQQEYLPRSDFGARLEPAAGIIHGAGQDPQSYREYARLFDQEHQPWMLMTYIGITHGVEHVRDWQRQMELALGQLEGRNTRLQIGLNMTLGNDDGSGADTAVADGRFGDAVEAFIQALKALGAPAYVRIGYEFEGSWNGYTAQGYVAAFKYISDRIRDAGLDDVATVWCAAGGSAGFIDFEDLMAFYPGDAYVDWWGVDTFSPEELGDPWLAEFFARAARHQKPVMIGEATPRYVGVIRGQESWDRWFAPFFEMVRRHPEIKATSYINWDWAYWSDKLGFEWHDWEDARLQENDVVRRLYVEELTHPIWIHSPGPR